MRGNGVDDGAATDGDGQTFEELFWDTFRTHGWEVPASAAAGWTFMFELTGPANQVVVQHSTPQLALLGARHRVSGKELGPDAAQAMAQRAYEVGGRLGCGRCVYAALLVRRRGNRGVDLWHQVVRCLGQVTSIAQLQEQFVRASPRQLEGEAQRVG